jgi:hypothetical protein
MLCRISLWYFRLPYVSITWSDVCLYCAGCLHPHYLHSHPHNGIAGVTLTAQGPSSCRASNCVLEQGHRISQQEYMQGDVGWSIRRVAG